MFGSHSESHSASFSLFTGTLRLNKLTDIAFCESFLTHCLGVEVGKLTHKPDPADHLFFVSKTLL
jgi:hypothetical protein